MTSHHITCKHYIKLLTYIHFDSVFCYFPNIYFLASFVLSFLVAFEVPRICNWLLLIAKCIGLKIEDWRFSEKLLQSRSGFTSWNPSPLQPSKFSFEYLLLPPRSAPEADSLRLTPKAASQPPRPPTTLRHDHVSGWASVARLSAIHFRG